MGSTHSGHLPLPERQRVQYSCTVHSVGADGQLQPSTEEGLGRVLEARPADGTYIILRDEGGLRACTADQLTALPDPPAGSTDSRPTEGA